MHPPCALGSDALVRMRNRPLLTLARSCSPSRRAPYCPDSALVAVILYIAAEIKANTDEVLLSAATAETLVVGRSREGTPCGCGLQASDLLFGAWINQPIHRTYRGSCGSVDLG